MARTKNPSPEQRADIVRRFYKGDKVGVIGLDHGITGSAISNIVAKDGHRASLRLRCPHCHKDIGLTVKQDRVKYGRARDQ